MKRKQAWTAAMLLLISLAGLSVGWTVAWLTSETKSIKNVFTVGSVQVRLAETYNTDLDGDGYLDGWKGVLVPGTVLTKDPQVIVPEDCEDSWIFVQLQEKDWPVQASYAVAEGWKLLEKDSNVYYREFLREDNANVFHVLQQDQIQVDASLMKQEIQSLGQPQLTVTAYAVQRAGFDSPEEAWEQVKPTI